MLKVILIVGFTLGIMFVLFLLTAPSSPVITQERSNLVDGIDDRTTIEQNADFENKPNLIIGDPAAAVTLVEYGDFKCPSCNQFHHTVGAQIRDIYVSTGLVNIEYRNYPFLGPDSGRAARGAYCAYDQDVFTEYHDSVYNYLWDNYYTKDNLAAEFEDILTLELLRELMVDDLVDPDRFVTCMSDTDYNRFIDADLLLGADEGVTGTPGFTIAGRKINGPSNYNTFKTLFDIELQKAN